MRFEIQTPLRRTVVLFALFFSGCVSVPKKEECTLPLHCARGVSSPGLLVRTGGLFEKPRDIYRQVNEPLTLRQALHESGGIRLTEKFELAQAPLIQPVSSQAPASKPTLPANSISVLESIFGDRQKILSYFEAPQVNGIFIASYDLSEKDQPLEYLQDTLASLNSAIPSPNPRMNEVWYDQDTSDWNSLLTMAEKPFAAYRDNDTDFANNVIGMLRSLKIASDMPTSDQQSIVTKPSFNVDPKHQSDVLIGLTQSKTPNETIYFHPRLIYHTAIGDVQLHDKDFVFAVRVTDTSLPQSHALNDDFMIPVTGASEEYNAVQHSTHGRLKSILALVPNAERAPDHVFILSRPVSGKLGSEVFYLPLSVENTEWTPSDEFVKNGQARPGDSVIFAYAGRSPIVYDSLIAPIKASFDQKRARLVEESNCRQILPADGRYLSKARANWKYYSQTVVRNTTNILR